MIYKNTIKVACVTALTLCGMQTVLAQTEPADHGIPYEITVSGSFYPPEVETIAYPFTAASNKKSGACTLTIITGANDQIMDMAVKACSHSLFEEAAQDFISRQEITSIATQEKASHLLHIKWTIGKALDQDASIQLVGR